MKPKAGRKIVSKAKYVQLVGDKVVSRLIGFGFFVLALLSFLLSCRCIFLIVSGALFNEDMESKDAMSLPVLVALVPFIYFLCRAGQNAFSRAASIPKVIPFSRANTADLPAPDSLVRASTEPEQAQQAVLLRATQGGQEQQAEELVRASVGK